MKVCLLYPHLFGHDGYVRDINTLYDELSRQGKHQISKCPPVADPGIHGRLGVDELKLVKPLLAALREVDVVHVFGFFFPLYPLLITLIRLSGKPYVLSPLAQLETRALDTSRSRKALFIKAFGRGMLNKAAVVHAFAESEADAIAAIAGQANVVKAPLGIYYEDIPSEIGPSLLRPQHDYFLLFGRLAYFHKGIDVLLDGYKRYLANGGQTELVIAGKSWAGSHNLIRQRIHELGIGAHAHFLGETSLAEKFALMHECKAFIYPSRYDGPPRPLRDALALRKPVLASRQSNLIADLASHGWGYTFDPVPEAMADAMWRMDSEYVPSHYQNPQSILSWSAVADQYSRIYDSLSSADSVRAVAF